MYQDEYKLYLSSLVIWSLSKQVMKEVRVIGVTEEVNFVVEDENYVFAKNFMK